MPCFLLLPVAASGLGKTGVDPCIHSVRFFFFDCEQIGGVRDCWGRCPARFFTGLDDGAAGLGRLPAQGREAAREKERENQVEEVVEGQGVEKKDKTKTTTRNKKLEVCTLGSW